MNYLEHHGILGQKWGIRRFQNDDGSLTSAGRRRYKADDVDSISSAKGIKRRLNDLDRAIAYNKKHMNLAYNKNERLDKKGFSSDSEKMKKNSEKIEHAEEMIQKGKEETSELIKRATSKGMSVRGIQITRKTRRGVERFVDHYLHNGSILGTIIGNQFNSSGGRTQSGYRYKVKDDGQGKYRRLDYIN